MKGLLTALLAMTIGIQATAYAESGFQRWLDANRAENESMIQYAERNHRRLLDAGATHSINPNYTGSLAEWRYYMPDGAVVSCLRGAQGYTFVYECTQR